MTSDSHTETILLALVGLSPAVLTETLWAWVHENPDDVPDRIITLTTTRGRKELERTFFTEGHWNAFRNALAESAAIDLSGKLRFGPTAHSIQVFPTADFQGELEDVTNLSEHEVVADFLLERLRSFTENESCRLVASIAGGRKTMGAILYAILQMMGRPSDIVTHVLVNSPWDRIPDFFYPGCPGDFRDPSSGNPLDSHQAIVQLAELPLIPIRSLFENDGTLRSGSFTQLAKRFQSRVSDMEEDLELRLYPSDGNVTYGDQNLPLTPREFAYLLFFAERAQREDSPLRSYKDLDSKTWLAFAKHHCAKEDFSHWSHLILENASFQPDEELRKHASQIRRKLRDQHFTPFSIDRLLPSRGHLAMRLNPDSIFIEPSK